MSALYSLRSRLLLFLGIMLLSLALPGGPRSLVDTDSKVLSATSRLSPAAGTAATQTSAFSTGIYSAGEGAAYGKLIVRRLGGAAGEAHVDYGTSDGTATAGSDYTPDVGTLVFAEGENTKFIIVPLYCGHDDRRQ
ncbi:MAG: hypothetical protein C4321_03870 [Chloroflexota bacterium]